MDLQREAGIQRSAANRYLWEKEALLESLARYRREGPAVVGVTGPGANGQTEMSSLGDRIVYVIATKCGNCPRNFPWLNEIEAASPGAVLGVSIVDRADTLPEYRAIHQVAFPIVKLTGGWLLDALPRHATPVTVVVRDNRITRVETGALSDSLVTLVAKQVVNPFSGRD